MHGSGQRIAWAFVAVLLLTSFSFAREVILHLNDGRQIKGTLVKETDSGITVNVSTVDLPIDRVQIKDVEYLETPAEMFDVERARLADDDIDGRFILVNELLRKGEYDLAKKELDSMLEIAPTDGRLINLRDALNERHRRVGVAVAQNQIPNPPQRSAPAERKGKEHLLTEEQIHLIRVYEIDLDVTPPPRVRIPRDVVDQFLTEYADQDAVPKGAREQAEFRRMPGYKQLEAFFAARARPLYSKVIVDIDPPVLANFKRTVHNSYVVNYCGAVNCHGNMENETGFTLIHDRRNSPEVAYTNFYILTQSDTAAGMMINRDNPEKSLLVQYGLDRRAAATPHPEVDGMRPAFVNDQMPVYKRVVEWIDELWTPAPDYGLDFTLPGKQQEQQEQPPVDTPEQPNAPAPPPGQ